MVTIPDSNQTTGEVKEIDNRESTFVGTLFADSAVDAGYEYSQLEAAAEGTLDQLGFRVGAAMTDTNPALAHQIQMPLPEATEDTIAALGTKAAHDLVLTARGAGAGSGNDELEIIFD